MSVESRALRVLEKLDREGMDIPLEDWVLLLQEVRFGIRTRLQAAEEDVARKKRGLAR